MNINSRSRKRTIEDDLYLTGWIILILFAAICAWHMWHPDFVMPSFLRFLGFGTPCKIHALTGYYCPGCGGTRSVIALFHGRLLVSAIDYPLTMYAAVLYLWFMLSQTIQRLSHGRCRIGLHWRSGYLWGALAILVLHFVIKNIFYMITSLEPFL